jgi:hypothetical protein
VAGADDDQRGAAVLGDTLELDRRRAALRRRGEEAGPRRGGEEAGEHQRVLRA